MSDDGPESVFGLSWGSFWCSWGRLGSPLGNLEGLWGVSWDPFGDLSSTKKFVLELLMASVDLDVLFFSCLLFCPCFSSFGVAIFQMFQNLWTVSTNLLVWCRKSMNVSAKLLVDFRFFHELICFAKTITKLV